MARILISGITGLLGTHFANFYAKRGYTVTGFARNVENLPTSLNNENIKVVQGDVNDIVFLNKFIQPKDIVIHCAAKVSFNPKDKNLLHHINVEGTFNVVNACLYRNVSTLLYVSSVAALGKPPLVQENNSEIKIIDESQTWVEDAVNSTYANTKFEGELEVWRGKEEGLPIVIINPSIILGESNWHESSSRLFKYVWDKNKFETGGYLNYVDVKDVVSASFTLLNDPTKWNQRYILNGGRVKFHDFFNLVGEAFGRNVPRIKLSKFWIELLWRVEWLRSKLFKTDPLITKETSISAQLNILFSSERVKKTLNMEFTPLENTINRVATYYKQL